MSTQTPTRDGTVLIATAALETECCACGAHIASGGACVFRGREVRAPGTLASEYRTAAYVRRLAWARGAGLDLCNGFRGLADELGPNPPLAMLDAALEARVGALPPLEDNLVLSRQVLRQRDIPGRPAVAALLPRLPGPSVT